MFAVETKLLDLLEAWGSGPISTVFILASPRTGSTFLYQAMASWFNLPFIANLTNDHFAEQPVIGFSIQKALNDRSTLTFQSAYGKTNGILEPSEGSAVISHWFGGGHPSQLVSTVALPDRAAHFQATLRAAQAIFGQPLLIKNAWNCFRIAYLATTLPEARFIWLRRDISDCAKSDLEARYATKGRADVWNSATPANLEDLKVKPPAEQVVENQIEFNRAIGDGLRTHASGRWIDTWYEDICRDHASELSRLGQKLGIDVRPEACLEVRPATQQWLIPKEDNEAIEKYVQERSKYTTPLRYKTHSGT